MRRPGETRSRSDTMILVSIDPKLDKAAIISIPRDTRVEIAGSALKKYVQLMLSVVLNLQLKQ